MAYNIYHNTAPTGIFTGVATSETASKVLTDLAVGYHYWRVTRSNAAGESGQSNTAAGVVITPPDAITATNRASDILINHPKKLYATYNRLERSTNGTSGWVEHRTTTDNSSPITSLTGGSWFRYRGQSDATGSPQSKSAYSAPFQYVAPTLGSFAITSVVQTGKRPKLTWSASAGAMSYDVYKNGTYITNTTALTWTDTTDVTTATSYFIRAKVALTTKDTATWNYTPVVPLPPTNVKGVQSGSNINVSWTHSATARDKYRIAIYKDGTAAGNYVTNIEVSGSLQSYTYTPTAGNGTYYFRMLSIKDNWESAWAVFSAGVAYTIDVPYKEITSSPYTVPAGYTTCIWSATPGMDVSSVDIYKNGTWVSGGSWMSGDPVGDSFDVAEGDIIAYSYDGDLFDFKIGIDD